MRPSSVESPRPSSVGSVQSNHSSNRGGKRFQYEICVGEELKIAVDIAIERFRLSEEQRGEDKTVASSRTQFQYNILILQYLTAPSSF